jgi:glutaredoxin
MFCAKVKEFLSQNKIEYTDRNIAADESALADLEKLGYMTTPVTVVDGEVVIGFDRASLEKLLLSWNDFCFYLWQSLNQSRHHVIRQMVKELAHCVDSLLASRTARHDYTSPALRDWWRLMDEIVEVVAADFLL